MAIYRRQFLVATAMLGAQILHGRPDSRTYSWQSAAPMPVRTQEIYPTVHAGQLVVAGGIARKLGVPYFTDAVFAYDPQANQWSERPALPEAIHHAALAVQDGGLILAGGFNGSYTQIWRMSAQTYRLSAEGWIAEGELPQPQAEGVLATHGDGALHLVTGVSPIGSDNRKRSDHAEVANHWVRPPGGGKWDRLAPIPTPRNSATGGWLGDQLIVTGGRTAAGNLDPTEIYDQQEDRWRTAAPLPLPQAGTASAMVDDGLIVFGGEIFKPEAGVFANVWRYSISQDTWTALPDMPTPRHGIGAGKIGNKIFVVGGATEPSGSGTSDANEVLVLAN